MRRIWIAVGASGALLAAVLAFTLMPTTPPAPDADGAATPTTPGAVEVPAARRSDATGARRPVSGGVNTPEAKEAWLLQRFGADLNADNGDSANGEGAESRTKLVKVVVQPLPPAPPLSPKESYEHFQAETAKVVEHLPNAKDAVDEMKEEITAAQHMARMAADRADADRARQ